MAFDKSVYDQQYQRDHVIRKQLTFNRDNPEDMELLAHAQDQPDSFVAYIKRLIAEDAARNRSA